MAHWTAEQDGYLAENAHRGVQKVQRGLWQSFGVRRSEDSIRRHAARLGVSLRRWELCPHCGRGVPHLNGRFGLCPACSAREQAERDRAAWEEARENARRDAPEVERRQRESAMYRQRRHRARRV